MTGFPSDDLASDDQASMLSSRRYTAPGVTVSYDVARCLHVRACVQGLPQVFDVSARPWIRPANAAAEAVAEVVRRCPTGALHALLSAGPPEQPDTPTTIMPLPDGPLNIRGDLRVVTPTGEQREVRATLCRCGASGNKPYCDGTHSKVGWKG